MIALGIAGALIYIAASGKVKNPALSTALISVGAVTIARRTPVLNQYAA